jgi:hypothetical protein
MKTKYFFMTALIILLLVMLFTQNTKEGFLNSYCGNFKDCMSCAGSSGCSWCPKSKVCLTSTTLKSTDPDCNQNNTITSTFRCPSAEGVEPPTLPAAIASDDVMYEFSLYKNRITDKIPPPNLYMSGDIKVSNEDLLSNMNDVRNDIANYKVEMPGIIASTLEQQIKPMVKGILAENYYIQGFEDMNKPSDDNKCKTYTSCSSCVNDSKCGWDPRMTDCDTRGPNKTWYITQPSRCVTTPSTQKLMITQPN